MVSPAYPMLWDARYSDNTSSAANYAIPVQTGSPKTTYTTISSYYGPWDDYGNSSPWGMWQYGSVQSIPGFNTVDTTVDGDVSHGDIEYVKDMMVPAVWWNNSSGDWSTLANWNSGQSIGSHANGDPAPTAPYTAAGQYPAVSGGVLPVPRLPGTAGSGPAITSGVNDTVILERPSANITVTLSSGTYNIRKLYMRETLNITGGSLTINYDPNYNFNVGNPDALRSGPLSAQFSGSVALSGTGSLSVSTLQVDASRTFTLAGSTGTLTFKTINLLNGSVIVVNGDVNVNPLANATATIANNGTTGMVNLNGGTRVFNVGDGGSAVDLDVGAPIANGGLTKTGAGTMRMSGNNTFGGAVMVNAGVLRYNHSSGLPTTAAVTVNNGGTLDMNNITDTIASLASAAGNTTGAILQGTAGLSLAAGSGTSTFDGTITGTGSLFKSGAYTQILNGNNSLGAVTINAGTLLFNGNNTTGNVSVSGGIFGGAGSVSGAVTIQSGAHLAPGASIESLGVGALTLSAGSILNFEVGPPSTSDLVNVSGLLTLNGGSLNIVNTGGLSIGAYTFFTYGTLGGSPANLNLPSAPGNLNYSLLDTGSQIALVVSLLGDFNFDGIVSNADYVVWRKGLGTTYTQADYDLWRAHYGETPNAGPGAGAGSAVPEPAGFALLLLGCLGIMSMRQSRR